MPAPDIVRMEGVRIIFRNFEGREQKYNKPGDRGFAVVLDDETAEAMLDDGWNVKQLNPREDAEEGETPLAFLPVSVEYGKGRPPRVGMVTSGGLTWLTEETIGQLDGVDIANIDMSVRAHNWSAPGGKSGIKAYVKSMYVTIEEDEIDQKYSHLVHHADQ